jgi:phage gp29-like protein/GNAT superfamily N-acetyltransferase
VGGPVVPKLPRNLPASMARLRVPKAELAAKATAPIDAPPAPTTESLIADTRRSLAWPPNTPTLQWNPDALQSSKGGLAIYDTMRVDEQIQAALAFRVACCIGPGWTLEPASNDPADREFADLLTRDLIELPGAFERVLRELLTAIAYGYALAEATYRLDETAMRLATIKVRAPHHVDFVQDGFGNVTAVRQQVLGPSLPVPITKFVHYINQGEFDNPYGRSDLRAAYKPWFSKSFVWQLWMIWNERYADPPAYVNQPAGTTTAQRDEVLTILQRLQARTAFALPKDWIVSLLESGRQPREVFQLAIDRFDLAISRALLMPEKSGLSGGATTGGSYSLAQVQADTGVLLRNLEANALAACIQQQLIRPMAAYRDAARETPTFKLNPLTEDNVTAITDVFTKAVTAGTIIADGRDENHLRQLLKFPELGEAEQAQRDQQRAQDRAMAQVPAADGLPPRDGGKPATMADRPAPCPHFSGGSGWTYCSTCYRRVAAPNAAEMAAMMADREYVRGKTTPDSTPGSFAPKDAAGSDDPRDLGDGVRLRNENAGKFKEQTLKRLQNVGMTTKDVDEMFRTHPSDVIEIGIAGDSDLELDVWVSRYAPDDPNHEREPLFSADRTIHNGDSKYISNDRLVVTKSLQGQGIGTALLAAQVRKAAELGFSHIETRATRNDGWNGYYTWARLGFDAPIIHVDDKPIRDLLRARGVERISDLIKTPDGREWWMKNGGSYKGEFDLTPGSLSRRVLDAYAAQKLQKPKKST